MAVKPTKNRRESPRGPTPPGARDVAMEALLCGASINAASREANVDRHTVSDWMKPGHEFRAEFDSRRKSILDGLEETIRLGKATGIETLIAAARTGDTQAAAVLARLAEPTRIAGHDGGPLKIVADIETVERVKGALKAADSDDGET